MKKLLLAALAAATLSCGAFAADSQSAIGTALQAIQREIEARIEPGKGKQVQLDQPSGAPLTDAEKSALLALFGSEQPLRAQRTGTTGKITRYTLTLPGNDYRSGDIRSTWPDASWQYSVDASNVNGVASWGGIDIHTPTYDASIKDVSVRSTKRQGSPLASQLLRIGSLRFDLATQPGKLNADGIAFNEVATQQNKKLQQQFEFSIKRAAFADDGTVDDLHLDLRLRDLNADTFQKLETATKADQSAPLIGLAKKLIVQGAKLDLHDVSLSYGGGTFRMRGSVDMPGATMSDFLGKESFLNALEAHLNVELSTATLRRLSTLIARRSSEENDAQRLEAQTKEIYAYALGKAISSGYARLDKDRLVAVIDIQHGKISINGVMQPFSLADVVALLTRHAAAPPQEVDHTPTVVLWRDRGLDDVLLYGGNGDWHATQELCRRYAKNGDTEAAQRWCTKAGTSITAKLAEDQEAPPTIKGNTLYTSVPAGTYSINYVRFDANKLRRMHVKLDNPQTHEKWAAAMVVCLNAQAPSDRACITFSKYGGVNDIRASSQLYSADNKPRGPEHVLKQQYKIGEPITLGIYVDDKQVHFLLPNGDKLSEDVVFPAAELSLTCSTGDCAFSFD